MNARIFLLLFMLLIPLGLKAQNQAKITDALDDFQPEIILDEVEIPEAPVQEKSDVVPSAPKMEPLEKHEEDESVDLILEEPVKTERPEMETEIQAGKRTSVLVRNGQDEYSGVGEDTDEKDSTNKNGGAGEDASELIPFNPGSRMPRRSRVSAEGKSGKMADGGNDAGNFSLDAQIETDPAKALEAFLTQYQFPYSFIRVSVLKENIVSRPVDGVMQMEVPLIISFDAERYAGFQQELAVLLNGITVSAPQELDLTKIRHSLRPARKNVILNLQTAGERYIAFELSPECREILARHAALVPTAALALYDEGKNLLSRHYFPLLYRDVVKAYPINLLGVYHGDSQTIRIYPHQEEKFAEFVHEQAASFVIPDPFPVVAAYSASEVFLNRTTKNFYLESNFRREERFPEISYMIHVQIPTEHFQNIRFLNCIVMTDQAGVPVSAGKKKTEFSEEMLQILDENLTGMDGENSILEPSETKESGKTETVPSETLSEMQGTSNRQGTVEVSVAAENSETSGILLSQSEIASASALETAVKRILKAQDSVALSFFGEKELNVVLKSRELEACADMFGIELIRKTQAFTSAQSQIPSIGWMEISPGISLLLLDLGTPESTPAKAFTQEAAFWISLENGSLALVSCVLNADFIRLLNGKLRL